MASTLFQCPTILSFLVLLLVQHSRLCHAVMWIKVCKKKIVVLEQLEFVLPRSVALEAGNMHDFKPPNSQTHMQGRRSAKPAELGSVTRHPPQQQHLSRGHVD